MLFNFNFIRKHFIKLFIASFVLPPLEGEPVSSYPEREHVEITWRTKKKKDHNPLPGNIRASIKYNDQK